MIAYRETRNSNIEVSILLDCSTTTGIVWIIIITCYCYGNSKVACTRTWCSPVTRTRPRVFDRAAQQTDEYNHVWDCTPRVAHL